MCPEVADETNPGKEASPAGRVEVGRGCAISASGSFLAYCSLLVGLTGPAFLCCLGSFGDELAPGGIYINCRFIFKKKKIIFMATVNFLN